MTDQLSLFDQQPEVPPTETKRHIFINGKQIKPMAIIGQVAIVKGEGSLDVWHVLSDRYIAGFSPMCKRSDVEGFCKLLSRVDIDAYWRGGCVDLSIPAQAGKCMESWQHAMGIGDSRTIALNLVKDIPADHPIRDAARHWLKMQQAWSGSSFESPNERQALARFREQFIAAFPEKAVELDADLYVRDRNMVERCASLLVEAE